MRAAATNIIINNQNLADGDITSSEDIIVSNKYTNFKYRVGTGVSAQELRYATRFRNAFKANNVSSKLNQLFGELENAFSIFGFGFDDILWWVVKKNYSYIELTQYSSGGSFFGNSIAGNIFGAASGFIKNAWSGANSATGGLLTSGLGALGLGGGGFNEGGLTTFWDSASDSVGVMANSKYLQLDSSLPVFDVTQETYGVPIPFSASSENKISQDTRNTMYDLSLKTTALMRRNLLSVAYGNLQIRGNMAADATMPHAVNLINDLPTLVKINGALSSLVGAMATAVPNYKLFGFVQFLSNIGNKSGFNLRDNRPTSSSDRDFQVITSEKRAQNAGKQINEIAKRAELDAAIQHAAQQINLGAASRVGAINTSAGAAGVTQPGAAGGAETVQTLVQGGDGKWKVVSLTRDQLTDRTSVAGRRLISLDFNSDDNVGTGYGLIVIPDDATPQEVAAARAYVNGLVGFMKTYAGIDNYPLNAGGKYGVGIKTTSENGRGINGYFHTEGWFAENSAASYAVQNNGYAYAQLLAGSLGQIDGATFIPPHVTSGNQGAQFGSYSETTFARTFIIPNLAAIGNNYSSSVNTVSNAFNSAALNNPIQQALGTANQSTFGPGYQVVQNFGQPNTGGAYAITQGVNIGNGTATRFSDSVGSAGPLAGQPAVGMFTWHVNQLPPEWTTPIQGTGGVTEAGVPFSQFSSRTISKPLYGTFNYNGQTYGVKIMDVGTAGGNPYIGRDTTQPRIFDIASSGTLGSLLGVPSNQNVSGITNFTVRGPYTNQPLNIVPAGTTLTPGVQISNTAPTNIPPASNTSTPIAGSSSTEGTTTGTGSVPANTPTTPNGDQEAVTPLQNALNTIGAALGGSGLNQKNYSNQQQAAFVSFTIDVEGVLQNVDYLTKRIVSTGIRACKSIRERLSSDAAGAYATQLNGSQSGLSLNQSLSNILGLPADSPLVSLGGSLVSGIFSGQNATQTLLGAAQTSLGGLTDSLSQGPFGQIQQQIDSGVGILNGAGQLLGTGGLLPSTGELISALNPASFLSSLDMPSILPSLNLGSLGDLLGLASSIGQNGFPTSISGLIQLQEQLYTIICNFEIPIVEDFVQWIGDWEEFFQGFTWKDLERKIVDIVRQYVNQILDRFNIFKIIKDIIENLDETINNFLQDIWKRFTDCSRYQTADKSGADGAQSSGWINRQKATQQQKDVALQNARSAEAKLRAAQGLPPLQ